MQEVNGTHQSQLVKFLSIPLTPKIALMFGFFFLYSIVAVLIFEYWIDPSLQGQTSAHVAADSMTYMYFADCLNQGCSDPWVLASLARFPNTLWAPVLIAMVIKSTMIIAAANIAVFFICLWIMARTFPQMDPAVFTILLLANATTLISLLSVNKEIIDLFVITLFCQSRVTNRKVLLASCLIVAFINRYEVCCMLLLFLFLESRMAFWRSRRGLTLAGIVLILTVLLPLFAMQSLASRFEEVQQIGKDGVLVTLDNLEMHFAFVVAVAPKLILVMFGDILSFPSRWSTFSLDDAANTYIVLLNNLANVFVLAVLLWKRTTRLESDVLYLACVCGIVVCTSLVNQPRYFYICYALLCVQAAHPSGTFAGLAVPGQKRAARRRAHPISGLPETTGAG